MNYPISRFSDSLIMAKAEKIANALARQNWRLEVNDQRNQLFSEEHPANAKNPWRANSVAARLSKSVGVTAQNFTLLVDGRHTFQVHRVENQMMDRITIQREWFGGAEEANRLAYVEASDVIGSEFGISSSKYDLPATLSDELGRFVETRDQSLARLEDLYVRFTQKLFEERDQLAAEHQEQQRTLNNSFETKRGELAAEFERKESALTQREQALAERLKKIDDRDAKHARRGLRESIITELNKRDASFTLTKGTQRLRWPVWIIIVISGLLFAAGLGHNAYIAKDVLAVKADGFNWALLYFVLKQITYTAGLLSVIFFGIKWSDRWFREHANEELKAKTMQIDILRANWVVETLLEWKAEGNPIPAELLGKLTHNLFRYPDEVHSGNESSNLASLILGSASKAKLKVGPDSEIQLSRSGARQLSKHLSVENAGGA